MVRPVSPNREAGLFWFWNLCGHLVFVRKRLWGEREREPPSLHWGGGFFYLALPAAWAFLHRFARLAATLGPWRLVLICIAVKPSACSAALISLSLEHWPPSAS